MMGEGGPGVQGSGTLRTHCHRKNDRERDKTRAHWGRTEEEKGKKEKAQRIRKSKNLDKKQGRDIYMRGRRQ